MVEPAASSRLDVPSARHQEIWQVHIRMDHAIIVRPLLRSTRVFVALWLLLSACSDTKDAATAPEVLNVAGPSINVAAAASGATVLASSVYSAAYAASGVINGDRAGTNWAGGTGGWNDGTSNQWPDWLEVSFAGSQTIGEVNVFTVQDNYQASVAPSLGQTFTLYGLTDFQIEAWNGTAWVVVPNGTITGNTQVWRQVTFPPVTTTKIRLWITGTKDNTWSRVTEVEAWTVATGTPPGALGKTSLGNGATPSPSGVTLSWSASSVRTR